MPSSTPPCAWPRRCARCCSRTCARTHRWRRACSSCAASSPVPETHGQEHGDERCLSPERPPLARRARTRRGPGPRQHACSRRWSPRARRPSSCRLPARLRAALGAALHRGRPGAAAAQLPRLRDAADAGHRTPAARGRAGERQLERALEVRLRSRSCASPRCSKLVERRVAEIESSARSEQRSLDELASRAAWNRLAAATTRF